MKVCLVGRDFPPKLGGLADCTYWLARSLADHVHVSVIAEMETSPAGEQEGMDFRPFSRWSWKGTASFIRTVRAVAPDVLVLNMNVYMFGSRGICFYLLFWMYVCKVFLRLRLVVNFIELYALPASLRHRPVSFIQKRECRFLAQLADAVATTDERYAAEIRSWLPPHRRPPLVVPVGGNIPPVSMNPRARAEKRAALAGKAEFLVGTFSHVRQPERVTETWSRLRAENVEAKFLVIGDARKLHAEDWNRLESLSRQRGVDDLIAETGYLQPSDVSTCLQALDAYLYLDRRIWTKSGTIMAALEHGVPVIAFNDRKEDREFRHGDNVYIADPDDPAGLARATRDVLTDAALRRRLAVQGKKLYDSAFSWPVIGRMFLPLLSA